MTAQQSGPPRRVVAGLGPDGRSRVVSDAPVASGTMPGIAVFNLWTGSIGQTDNAAPWDHDGQTWLQVSVPQVDRRETVTVHVSW